LNLNPHQMYDEDGAYFTQQPEIRKWDFQALPKNDTTIMCGPAAFEGTGTDPFPGHSKVCMCSETGPGQAVQIDPIKPTLKAPGIKLLKLKCDDPRSNFAFTFNLRRYTQERSWRQLRRRRRRRRRRQPRRPPWRCWGRACQMLLATSQDASHDIERMFRACQILGVNVTGYQPCHRTHV